MNAYLTKKRAYAHVCKASSKEIARFPDETKSEALSILGKLADGVSIDAIQSEHGRSSLTSLTGFHSCWEIRLDEDKDTYRVFLLLTTKTVWILHSFKKKSKKGRSTPRKNLETLALRLKAVTNKTFDKLHVTKG